MMEVAPASAPDESKKENAKMAWVDCESSDDDNEEEQPPAEGATDRSARQKKYVKGDTRFPSHPPYVAFVYNIPYTADEKVIGEFFESGGLKVTNVEIQYDADTKKSRGFANVEFEDLDSLKTSLEANGVEIDGRPIKVDIQNKRRGDLNGQRRDGKGGRGMVGPGKSKADTDNWNRGLKKEGQQGKPMYDGADKELRKGVERVYNRDRLDKERKPSLGSDQKDKTIHDGPKEGEEGEKKEPASRPKIVLQARTLPVESIGQPIVANSSIFGGGKPVDVLAFEEERLRRLALEGKLPAEAATASEIVSKEKKIEKNADGSPERKDKLVKKNGDKSTTFEKSKGPNDKNKKAIPGKDNKMKGKAKVHISTKLLSASLHTCQ